MDIAYIAASAVVLAGPHVYNRKDPKDKFHTAVGLSAITGVVLIIAALPRWHDPDLSMSSVSLKSKTFPPTMVLPHVGHPGLQRLPCEVSGMHSNNLAPAIPDDMNSETATTIEAESLSFKGWNPQKTEMSQNFYKWKDWVGIRVLLSIHFLHFLTL